jgi:hypothetical protein
VRVRFQGTAKITDQLKRLKQHAPNHNFFLQCRLTVNGENRFDVLVDPPETEPLGQGSLLATGVTPPGCSEDEMEKVLEDVVTDALKKSASIPTKRGFGKASSPSESSSSQDGSETSFASVCSFGLSGAYLRVSGNGGLEADLLRHLSKLLSPVTLPTRVRWELKMAEKKKEFLIALLEEDGDSTAEGQDHKILVTSQGPLLLAYRQALEDFHRLLLKRLLTKSGREAREGPREFSFDTASSSVHLPLPPKGNDLNLWMQYIRSLVKVFHGEKVAERVVTESATERNQFRVSVVLSGSLAGQTGTKLVLGEATATTLAGATIAAIKDVVELNFPKSGVQVVLAEVEAATTNAATARSSDQDLLQRMKRIEEANRQPVPRSPPPLPSILCRLTTACDTLLKLFGAQVTLNRESSKEPRQGSKSRKGTPEEPEKGESNIWHLSFRSNSKTFAQTKLGKSSIKESAENPTALLVIYRKLLSAILSHLDSAEGETLRKKCGELEVAQYRQLLETSMIRKLPSQGDSIEHRFLRHFDSYLRSPSFFPPLTVRTVQSGDSLKAAVCSGEQVLGCGSGQGPNAAREAAFAAAGKAMFPSCFTDCTGTAMEEPEEWVSSPSSRTERVPEVGHSLFRHLLRGDSASPKSLSVDGLIEVTLLNELHLLELKVYIGSFSSSSTAGVNDTVWRSQMIAKCAGARVDSNEKAAPTNLTKPEETATFEIVVDGEDENPFNAMRNAQRKLVEEVTSRTVSSREGQTKTKSPKELYDEVVLKCTSQQLKNQDQWTFGMLASEMYKKVHGVELAFVTDDEQRHGMYFTQGSAKVGNQLFNVGSASGRSKKESAKNAALMALQLRPEYQTMTSVKLVADANSSADAPWSIKTSIGPMGPDFGDFRDLTIILREAMVADAKPRALRVEKGPFSGGHYVRLYEVPLGAKKVPDLRREKQIAYEKNVDPGKALNQACFKVLQQLYPDLLAATVEKHPEILQFVL